MSVCVWKRSKRPFPPKEAREVSLRLTAFPSRCGREKRWGSSDPAAAVKLEKPDTGTVRVRGRIGFVPQDPYASLDPKLNVYRCIAEPLIFLRLQKSWAACEGAVRAVMEQVHLNYEDYKDRLPSQLSGGERQRVSICRALVHQPDLLILDEPTSMIDQEVRLEIVSLLRSLAVHGQRALLMVTHDIVISVGICERLLVMERGRVVEEGCTEDVLNNPKADLTRRLTLASQDIRAYWDTKSW